jgi:hypothetical protein
VTQSPTAEAVRMRQEVLYAQVLIVASLANGHFLTPTATYVGKKLANIRYSETPTRAHRLPDAE